MLKTIPFIRLCVKYIIAKIKLQTMSQLPYGICYSEYISLKLSNRRSL